MATYKVHCSQLGETEYHTSEERAVDLCFSMHNESGGYAYVEDYYGNKIYEYGEKN